LIGHQPLRRFISGSGTAVPVFPPGRSLSAPARSPGHPCLVGL